MTNSSSSPSLLNDSAKPYAGHGKTWSLFIFSVSDSKNNMFIVEILKIINGYEEENKNDVIFTPNNHYLDSI